MGPAGCGKSTRLPKMLPEEDENHCVAVGEPRARQLANRVAEEQGESVGCKVGLFTGHERTPPEYQVGSVSFAVYETLHHRLQLVGARGVSRVVIDEVHEWSIILELILKRLRAILKRNAGSNFRVVLMSATLDAEALQRYFSDVDAHVVEIKGSSYPTKWCWSADWSKSV